MNSNSNTRRSGLRKTTTGRKKRATVAVLLLLLLVVVVVLVVAFQLVRIEVVSSDEDEEKAEGAGARVALPCDPSLNHRRHEQGQFSSSVSSSRRENDDDDDDDDGKEAIRIRDARRTSKSRLCEDPERVDSLIRSHACETGASGEHVQAQLRAMPRKPSSSDTQEEEEETKKSHNDDNKNNIERRIRKKRRKLLNNVEDADPEMENQEMNRVLERFRAGRMRVDGTRNIFHDPEDGKAASTLKTYKTCAVVGNSGTLQKTAYGAMIDSAEAVFRVNDGVAKRGCSLYAGSRTTVRVVDAKALGKMEILADDEEEGTTSTTTNSFRSRNETMVVLVNADEHERETIASSEYFNHAKSVKRVHEDVQDGASVLMHSFREHLAKVGKMQGAGGNVPSTGMITYYLALRLCDFVGLYGFGLYVEKERVENTPSSGKKKSVAPVTAVHDFYRYYDAKRNVELGMRQTHSFDTERMLMSLLSRSTGRSKLCGFKKDGDEDEVTKRIRREQDRRARQLARRTGRGKVKGGSASNSNAASASSESANTGVSVAEEKPIEHTVDWEARLGDSAGSAG